MRRPLPEDIPPVFSTREALARGIPRSRLRASDLERPVRGAYVSRPDVAKAGDEDGMLRKVSAGAAALSGDAFACHVTAAGLWRAPLPFRLTADRDVDFGVLHPSRPPRLDGVRGHRVQPNHVRIVTHPELDLRVTSPASTWAMLGRELRHPYDLVAVADSFVSDRVFGREGAIATVAQLRAATQSGRRVGINALRDALPRVRLRVSSRTETWTRLVLVDAGLPEPEINWFVHDDQGRLLACVDLAYPALKVAIEYEGRHHLLDGDQWTSDIERYERLSAAGWIVIRVTKEHLFDEPHDLTARVRAALASR